MNKHWLLFLLGFGQFVQAAPPLEISLYKDAGQGKEIISVDIANKANQAVQFKTLSLQQLVNNQWTLIIYDINCPCLAKCNTPTTTLPPQKTLNWVFNFNTLGCGAIAQGAQYRAVAQGSWNNQNNARTLLGQSAAFIPVQ